MVWDEWTLEGHYSPSEVETNTFLMKINDDTSTLKFAQTPPLPTFFLLQEKIIYSEVVEKNIKIDKNFYHNPFFYNLFPLFLKILFGGGRNALWGAIHPAKKTADPPVYLSGHAA